MQDPVKEQPPGKTPESEKTGHRHGCLTAYLVFLIVTAILAVLAYTAGRSLAEPLVKLPGWAFPFFAIMGILELVCAIALLRWMKWGFWGFCGIAVVLFIIYIILGQVSYSFSGLVGVAILLWVLNIGDDDNKGWPQLH